jgi:hypothetical protein
VKLDISSRSAVIQKMEQPMSAMPSATSFTWHTGSWLRRHTHGVGASGKNGGCSLRHRRSCSGTRLTAADHEEVCCAREEAEVHVSTHEGLPRPGYEPAASFAKYFTSMPSQGTLSSR